MKILTIYIEKIQKVIQKNSVIFFLIFIFVLAAHGAGIFNGYTWDDKYLIPKAERISYSGNIPSFLQDIFTDRHAGSSSTIGSYYRPLRTLLFVFIASLPGPHTVYLHSLSILLHVIVSFMIFSIASSITKKRSLPLLGAMVFAVHPATTESVAGISNIKEILATLFVLISIYYLYRIINTNDARIRYTVIVVISTFLGLLSKETALVVPIISLAMLMIFRRQGQIFLLRGVLPVITVTAVYMLIILYLSPGPERGEYILGSPWITLYTTAAAFVEYFKIALWPAALSVRHDIDWVLSPFDWHVISVTVFILLLILLTVYLIKREDHRTLPVVFFLISLLPISNIIPLIGHVMAERYMYMPFSAACMLGATFFKEDKNIRYIFPVTIVLIVALTIRTSMRTLEWKDDTTLFESAVKVAPDSLVVRWNLHKIYSEKGEQDKARKEYLEMLRINREVVERYVYFARKRELEGDVEAAKKIWERAEYSASGNSELLEYVRSHRYRK